METFVHYCYCALPLSLFLSVLVERERNGGIKTYNIEYKSLSFSYHPLNDLDH